MLLIGSQAERAETKFLNTLQCKSDAAAKASMSGMLSLTVAITSDEHPAVAVFLFKACNTGCGRSVAPAMHGATDTVVPVLVVRTLALCSRFTATNSSL